VSKAPETSPSVGGFPGPSRVHVDGAQSLKEQFRGAQVERGVNTKKFETLV